MRASDVMTTEVISTAADAPLRDVARALLQHGISAVPVLDADGALIGMVSEGDLVSRDEVERMERRAWWLKLAAEDGAGDDDLLARLRAPDRTARDVMVAPVITVSEDTGLAEVARLLAQHHIKRVPVVKDGQVTGIVSRADLLVAVAAPEPNGSTQHRAPGKRSFLLDLFGEYHRPAWQAIPTHEDAALPGAGSPGFPSPDGTSPDSRSPGSRSPDSLSPDSLSPDSLSPDKTPGKPAAGLDAAAFRALIEDFQSNAVQHQDDERRAAAERRQQLAKQLIDTHVTDDKWQRMLHGARQAAEGGQKESLLLRFPNELCTDGGRAIDVAQDGWPATLRGEAAELYLRWERELKPRGFRLTARVLEYPDGMPGDIGLFLVWGEAA